MAQWREKKSVFNETRTHKFNHLICKRTLKKNKILSIATVSSKGFPDFQAITECRLLETRM